MMIEMRLARLGTMMTSAALLAGCGPVLPGSDGYPRDWPPTQPSASSCPDLTGRYAVGDDVMARVFVRRARIDAPGVFWRSMEITGDGTSGYALELTGTVDDNRVVRQRVPTVGLRCREGWAYQDLPHGTHDPIERAPDDDRRITRYVMIARDRDGNLVAQEVIERMLVIGIWAETGAGIPVPFTHSADRRWSRWLAFTGGNDGLPALHVLAGDADPGLQRLGRLLPADAAILSKRSEGDGHQVEVQLQSLSLWLEFEERMQQGRGDGSVEIRSRRQSSNGPVTFIAQVRPPRPSPRVDEGRIAAARVEHDRTETVARRVQSLLPKGGSISGVRPIDDGYLIDASFPSDEALSEFVGALNLSPEFGIPDVRSTRPVGGKAVVAGIWVRTR
jgi:hypothetical protein